MVAQYRLAGSLLGLTPSEELRSSHREAPAAACGADAMPAAHPGPRGPDTSSGWVTVILKGEHRRPVRIRRCEVARDALQGKVQFYSAVHIESEPLTAEFVIDANGRATLTLETSRSAPPGLWSAAICDAMDVQIGLIDIEL